MGTCVLLYAREMLLIYAGAFWGGESSAPPAPPKSALCPLEPITAAPGGMCGRAD